MSGFCEEVADVWEPLVSPTRSSSFLPKRHAALFGSRHLRALETAELPAALRGRSLRLAGRLAQARSVLDADAARSAESAAWLWEMDFRENLLDGRPDYSGIETAVRLEPARARWRAWLAAGRLCQLIAEGESAANIRRLREAQIGADEAAELDPKCLSALIVSGILRDTRGREDALRPLMAASRLAPRAAFLHRRIARILWRRGRRRECVARCEAALYADEGVGHFESLLEGEASDSMRGKIDAAGRHLSKEPNDYWMYVFRGDCRRSPEVNDPFGGLQDLETAVRLKPDCAYAWAYLSRARLTHAASDGAVSAANRSVLLNPQCGWIRMWRGETRRRLGDARGALGDLNRGLKLDPDYELGYAWRGGAKRSLGLTDACIRDLSTATDLDERLAWAYQEHSLALRQAGRVDEALTKLRQAHRLDPKFAWSAKPERRAQALAELNSEIRRHPGNAWAWAWRGETKLRSRDARGALGDLNRALALDRTLEWAHAWRGRAWFESGRRRAAIRNFDIALRRDARDAHAYAWRGRVRGMLGRPGALEDLRRAAELDKKTSWIYLWKGEAEENAGLLREAEEDYTRALAIDGKHVCAMVSRAAVRLRLGDGAGAREDIGQARAADASNARALICLARLQELEGFWGGARRTYEAALRMRAGLRDCDTSAARRFLERGPEAREDSMRRAMRVAAAFEESGEHLEAEAVCSEVLRVDAGHAEALRLRAQARRCAGRYAMCVSDLDRLVRLAPDNPGALINRGGGRRNAGDFRGALRDAMEALRRTGEKSADAFILKSEALRNLGRCGEAVEAATAATRLRPHLAWAYVVRGKARRQSGDIDGALADFNDAVGIDPADAKAHGWAADALRSAGRLKAARVRARRAVALQPTCAWAVALSGEIERESGRIEAGLTLIQRALELDKNASCTYDFLGAEEPAVRGDLKYAWLYAWRGGVSRAAHNWGAARRDLLHAVKLDASCYWARGWLGELKLASGDPRGALADIDEALRRFKNYQAAWTWRGRALSELKLWRQALRSYQRALFIKSDDPWAMIGCSACLEKLHRRKEAAAMAERARRAAPGLFAGSAAAGA